MGWLSDVRAHTDTNAKDDNGQPQISHFRSYAVQARQVDELIGLIKGVLADGVLYQEEVVFLLKWLETNEQVREEWPANVLYPRIHAALLDGHVDEQEEQELMSLLLATIGGNSGPSRGYASDSTSLPLSSPEPEIVFEGSVFCFTGAFNSGTRAWCVEQVESRGGLFKATISKKLDYLVIGDVGSRDWLHSTHGTKIKQAVDYRNKGAALHIISEQHWYKALQC